jgi:hypothetical protein
LDRRGVEIRVGGWVKVRLGGRRRVVFVKHVLAIVPILVIVLWVSGCATTDPQLRKENELLKADVSTKKAQIENLEKDNLFLKGELDFATLKGQVLEREKMARIDDVNALRVGLRTFTAEVMGNMRANFRKTDVSDYIGGELCERSEVAPEQAQLLVDFGHPIPRTCTLTGGRAFATNALSVRFCLLRQIEGTKYEVVGLSEFFYSTETGVQKWEFAIPLVAREGDLIGLYSKGPVGVPFDSKGTGKVATIDAKEPERGRKYELTAPMLRTSRAYSFGVVGYASLE